MKERKGKQEGTDKLVLVCENILVHKDPYCYVVTELIGERKRKPTYHTNLVDAIKEVSKRLFERKQNERIKAKQYDFESLVKLFEEHNEEMRKRFGI